jgi:hypothetical protein
VIGTFQWSGMIVAVTFRLLHLILRQVLGLLLLMGRTSSAKDVEVLVLQHGHYADGAGGCAPASSRSFRNIFSRFSLPPQRKRAGDKGPPGRW